MKIRKTVEADLVRIGEIYENAKRFMRESGNPDQWNSGTPNADTAREDMENGVGYVAEEDGKIVAVFMFSLDRDPTYANIYDGAWLNDEPYGVIHRIAGDGSIKGVLAKAVEFAGARFDYLRIDTHSQNIPMQNALKKQNFTQRGVIYIHDGTPRLAYDKIKEN